MVGIYVSFFLLVDHRVFNKFLSIINSKYVKTMIKYLSLLFVLTLLFSTIHLSYDYHFTKILFLLVIQFFIGCVLFAYIKTYNLIKSDYNIETALIYAFVIQSIIQCVVSFTPSLLPIIYYFNNEQAINESYTQLFGTGVRGVAMAHGTGFSLSLGYGIVFIIYIHHMLIKTINLKNIIIGFLLFIGVFFAGRSGFVGIFIGMLYYLISPLSGNFLKIIKNFLKIICSLFGVIFAICVIFPQFVTHIVDNVLPFAFEPLYNLVNQDELYTASTDRLGDMWRTTVSLKEYMIGVGRYYSPDGTTYYKEVDIGLYKSIFFGGILWYMLILIFQTVQLYPLYHKQINKNDKLFFLFILIFLFILDFKAVSLSINKTSFSIIILLVLSYEDTFSNSISAK